MELYQPPKPTWFFFSQEVAGVVRATNSDLALIEALKAIGSEAHSQLKFPLRVVPLSEVLSGAVYFARDSG